MNIMVMIGVKHSRSVASHESYNMLVRIVSVCGYMLVKYLVTLGESDTAKDKVMEVCPCIVIVVKLVNQNA